MFMPNSSCVMCVRMLAMILGMLHISLVSLLIIPSIFLMSGLENCGVNRNRVSL